MVTQPRVVALYSLQMGVAYKINGGPLGVLLGEKGVELFRSRVGGDACCLASFLCRSASASR